MKRIYNDIPLQSVLYLIRGDVKIIVEDWNEQEIRFPETGKLAGTWKGLAKDDLQMPWKYRNAKVREVEPIGEKVIRFKISTQFEQY